jgi:glutamate/tyrosine decarboxylase-like PLP-dependent enzyme
MHKYGYSAKGAGVILYRTKELRNAQVFVTDNWLGGLYGSSGILGTKSGGPIASAWAMMSHFGVDGYRELALRARTTTTALAEAIDAIDPLFVMTKPDSTLIAVASRDENVDVHHVADGLRARHWFVDRQGPPASIHMTVSAGHDAVIDSFVADLRDAVVDLRRGTVRPRHTSAYGTID